MTLKWEQRTVTFRGEQFNVMFPYYYCEDLKEQFTTNESDGVWYNQMSNQYRQKYGIPFVDEIISLRKLYGLSAAKMSLIFGFGPNQWGKYEHEEIPSVSNGKMISAAMSPIAMQVFVDSARSFLKDSEYEKITSRITSLRDNREKAIIERYKVKRLYPFDRGEVNGYAPISIERLNNLLVYILNRCGETWYTKMNKLLFYIDFLAYRETGMAISGLAYRAIDFGPVPQRWEKLYSEFDQITILPKMIGEYEGIVMTTASTADMTLFSEHEKEVIDTVIDSFMTASSKELTQISHQESLWIDNYSMHKMIPFSGAVELKAF